MTRTALSTSVAALVFVAACSGGSPSSPSSPAASLDGPSIDGGVVVRPSASLADTGEQEVAIDGDRAIVLKQAPGKGKGQSQGKVVLCHRDGNGYHAIDVSVNQMIPSGNWHARYAVSFQVCGSATRALSDDQMPSLTGRR